MGRRFDTFVILAEMRTGSNFLEENLNSYGELKSHGELFNPHFMGGPKRQEYLGITKLEREANPVRLLDAVKSLPDGINGFRFFHDHDPRVLDICLQDHRCAKVILTRNPVESYISREIVRKTQQWRLGDGSQAKSAKVTFDPEAFAAHLERHKDFQKLILKAMQVSGQTAFYLAYEDISDVTVMNGLAAYLGAIGVRKKPVTKTKKQNPQPLADKVDNFEEMKEALREIDYFDLANIPNFEPKRGASVPTYIAAASMPVMFLPIPGGPTESVGNWLADLEGVTEAELSRGFNQKTLRQWKRRSGDHRTFTVLRHPAERLHDAFIRHILVSGPDHFTAISDLLQVAYDMPAPSENPPHEKSVHRQAFLAFATFVQANLNGQTSVRVDPSWATQSEILRGFGQFALPDHIFREEGLAQDLGQISDYLGCESPELAAETHIYPIKLEDIYNPAVERAVRAAYQRDYMMFGFSAWKR